MPRDKFRARRAALVCATSIGACVSAAVLFPGQALAGERFWIAGSGFWDVGANWSATAGGAGGAGAPVNFDNALIDSALSLTVTRDSVTPGYVTPGLNIMRLNGTGGAIVDVAQVAGANAMFATQEQIG